MPTTRERHALIVEDQTTLRELLEALLGEREGFLVQTSADGKSALEALERQRFDLVLLDLVLPDMHGFELLSRLAKSSARVLVLTAQARPAVVKEALERGAHAVVTKGAPLRELREAIDRVSAGGVYYSSESSALLREAAFTPSRDEQLTERQREILREVASGLSSKEIAVRLSISEKTVSNHRTRIMERLGMHDVASLTRYAVSLGLVDPEV
jgi:DNA-binding NarL/FixJ family response regulator